MTIQIRDAALEARLKKQVEATGSGKPGRAGSVAVGKQGSS